MVKIEGEIDKEKIKDAAEGAKESYTKDGELGDKKIKQSGSKSD